MTMTIKEAKTILAKSDKLDKYDKYDIEGYSRIEQEFMVKFCESIVADTCEDVKAIAKIFMES